ncbi:hypothetical protein [Janibacter terrae]|uniref:hypothetical protein n=1 Tax=Janibacter terrae TaxID=103817 RepID=UPI003803DBCD
MTDDQDPTGMRHLLSGLKEKGPMPADLAERIRATLEDEHAQRVASTGEDDTSTFFSEMDDPDEARPRRRYRSAPLVLAAAAALVMVLGVGGLILERSAGGSDEAGSSAQTAQQESRQGSDAAAPREGKDSSTASASEAPAFAITASGRDYTRGTAGDDAARLLEDPGSVKANEDDDVLGTLTTAAGATDCLARLGQPQMTAVVVDVATFDGAPGLLLIAQALPAGGARAWAVTEGCAPIWSDPVDVPVR